MLTSFAGRLQTKDHDCGDAVVRSLLDYWGMKPAARMATAYDGTDPRTVEALFRISKLAVLSGSMDAGLLKHLTATDRPVCCLVSRDGVGHWVVVYRLHRGRVHFFDPIDGERVEPVKNFMTRWADVDRFGVLYHRFGTCPYRTD